MIERRDISRIAAGLLLASCTAPSVPPDYTGPLAHLTDSVTPRDTRSADFFYVSRIGDFPVDDSIAATEGSNRAAGLDKKPVVIERDVPAQPAIFTINGTTRYAAPMLAFTNPAYEISGQVNFTPAANHAYVVKGQLSEAYSAVWIEDQETGAVIGSKIEIKGPASLGVLGKLGIH